ncbi:26447_t:CDS:1, partial [Dentiscutata erythropus]
KSFKEILVSSIINEKKIITEQTKRLGKLKCHTEVQVKLTEKKAKLLEEGIVEKYDRPGRPLAAMIYSDFWDKIHDCIEFGSAHSKRRKVVIKVHTIKHLRQALKEKYNIYLSRQCISIYLEPRHPHTT